MNKKWKLVGTISSAFGGYLFVELIKAWFNHTLSFLSFFRNILPSSAVFILLFTIGYLFTSKLMNKK
jgi:uncharacterized membrane protein (Fun14 family)